MGVEKNCFLPRKLLVKYIHKTGSSLGRTQDPLQNLDLRNYAPAARVDTRLLVITFLGSYFDNADLALVLKKTLKAWEGLGYYSRPHRQSRQQIMESRRGPPLKRNTQTQGNWAHIGWCLLPDHQAQQWMSRACSVALFEVDLTISVPTNAKTFQAMMEIFDRFGPAGRFSIRPWWIWGLLSPQSIHVQESP